MDGLHQHKPTPGGGVAANLQQFAADAGQGIALAGKHLGQHLGGAE